MWQVTNWDGKYIFNVQLCISSSVYLFVPFLPPLFLTKRLLAWDTFKAHCLGRFWSQLSCGGGRTQGGHSAFHPLSIKKKRERERQKEGQEERTKEFRGMHYSACLEITLFTDSTKPKCPGGFHYLSFSNAALKKSSHLSRSQFQESQFIQLNGIKAPVGKRFERWWGRETVQFLHLSF